MAIPKCKKFSYPEYLDNAKRMEDIAVSSMVNWLDNDKAFEEAAKNALMALNVGQQLVNMLENDVKEAMR